MCFIGAPFFLLTIQDLAMKNLLGQGYVQENDTHAYYEWYCLGSDELARL